MKSNKLLRDIREIYKDYMLEFSCVINGVVQITGYSNNTQSLLSVQFDSTDIENRGVYIIKKPQFYLRGDDEYAHIRYIKDIPKPLKIYVADQDTNNKPVLIYSITDI